MNRVYNNFTFRDKASKNYFTTIIYQHLAKYLLHFQQIVHIRMLLKGWWSLSRNKFKRIYSKFLKKSSLISSSKSISLFIKSKICLILIFIQIIVIFFSVSLPLFTFFFFLTYFIYLMSFHLVTNYIFFVQNFKCELSKNF